ncbi:carbon storage regulator [Paracoccus hibiscisoli]|uniref:Carbon storage regulator n=1 Tax=Paracoccus hibiscisoli TaxID=2023261 RepID=A0A4U0QUP7_9RHOB|nr:carbon storage regulator [Paracoccus hibiscisoli]TJZ85827.1 carbon storage regulator [Paracoccus hibiscisoli]
MTKSRGGYGLMRTCSVASGPVSIRIGEITVTIARLRDQTADIGVKAPPEMSITFEDGRSVHDTVENAIRSVLKDEH